MLTWFVYFVVRDFEIDYMIMLACLFVSLIVVLFFEVLDFCVLLSRDFSWLFSVIGHE